MNTLALRIYLWPFSCSLSYSDTKREVPYLSGSNYRTFSLFAFNNLVPNNHIFESIYLTSLQFETDTVKCKAHCSTASGIVTMTARHGPTAIFTMPIIILIAIGGILFISTLGILIYFIRKSRRKRKKGYHFPLTGNTVEAYNLEVDIGPPVTCTNGTQVVVSDSYNLVDGWCTAGWFPRENPLFLLSHATVRFVNMTLKNHGTLW